jgi:UDP-N-acetylmuramoyl-tripeptide--D-alanyl-D-alanine ligase
VRFRVGLRGAHQVLNAAMAAIVAERALAVPLEESAARIEHARGSRWRMELLESPDGVVVLNDSYNANPSSMAASLEALAHLRVAGRRIAVLGDMRELGEHSVAAHTDIGRLLATLGIDQLVAVGVGGAEIAQAAVRGAEAAAGSGAIAIDVVADADAATVVLERIVQPGDAVLVKASRAVGLQTVAERLVTREAIA